MDQAGITASPRLRVSFLAVAALMFLLSGWSLVPPIENWNNPYDDGFSYEGVFYASIICLPTGLLLLVGGVGAGTLFIVVAFLIFQHIANSMGGLGLG